MHRLFPDEAAPQVALTVALATGLLLASPTAGDAQSQPNADREGASEQEARSVVKKVGLDEAAPVDGEATADHATVLGSIKVSAAGRERLKPTTVDTLVGIWRYGRKRDDDHVKDALRLLVQYPHPLASSVYLEELRHNTYGYAGPAAEALGRIGETDAIPGMLEIFDSTVDPQRELTILRGLARMPHSAMVETLSEVLTRSVDEYPIALHSYTCEILGDIAGEDPDALDDKTQRRVVRGMYLANEKGQNVSRECGLAVQQLGQAAVPLLLEVLRGENEAVRKLMARYNQPPRFDFPANRPKVMAVSRLVALRADEAVPTFMKNLREPKTPPTKLSAAARRSWLRFEAQALDEMVLGLGDLGARRAGETGKLLRDVLVGDFNDRWSPLLDHFTELQLRQDAAEALVRLGARPRKKALLEMARKGTIDGLEKRAKALKKAGRSLPAVQRYQFNWMSARAFAFLAEPGDRAAYEDMVESRESDELKAKMREFLPAFDVAERCLAPKKAAKKGAEKAACLNRELESDNDIARRKAAWELSRLPDEHAAPVLIEHLPTDDLELREILEFGLYRAPADTKEAKKAAGVIDEILEREADEHSGAHRLDHHRLKLLRAWLEHQT